MENVNLHKQKLYALIVAGVALISLILPWMTVSYDFGGFGGAGGSRSANGFRGWGYLSLIGVIVVVIASLLGDKTKGYEAMHKNLALAGFALVVVGAVIFFIRIGSVGNAGFMGVKTGPGFGLWIAIIAGLAGLGWVSGLIKMPDNKPTPPPPPPPAS